MKITVTGGAGFIGRELIRKLNALDYNDIIVVDNLDEYARVYDGLIFSEFKDFHNIDFSFLENVDFIFHLGANSSTRSKIEEIYEGNYVFTIQLFLEAKRKNIPVVFASSGAIYGSDRRISSAPSPLTAYGYTKLVCEKMINHFPDFYDNVVCLRYHNVYGATEAHKGDMSSIVYKWMSGAEHCLFCDSSTIKRDFVHVDDINEVHLTFIEYWEKFKSFGKTRIYDVGTGKAVSFQKLGNTIKKYTKKKIRYIDNPFTHENYQFYTEADTTALRGAFRKLGKKFIPMRIKDGVKKVYNDLYL